MMPFIDLKSQFEELEGEIRARIDRVLAHGQYIMGPEVGELEQKLAEFTGRKYCVSCASGTDALLLVLMAYGMGPGDCIVTTPFTFIATAEVIALCGATPIFTDVEPGTFNLDPFKLDETIRRADREGKKVRGIIAVDLFGLPCDYDALRAVASRHQLWVLEDAAQSFGSQYRGRRACALSDVGVTSFFPAKPLGCYGDGGAIFADDEDLVATLTSLRVHGQGAEKCEHVRLGVSSRLDTLQASILIAKLGALEKELEERQRVAERYTEAIKTRVPILTHPNVPDGYRSAWAQYAVLARTASERSRIRDALLADGIPTMIYYPKPLHMQDVFAYLGYAKGSLPVSEDLATRIFALPMHPYMTDKMIDSVVAALSV